MFEKFLNSPLKIQFAETFDAVISASVTQLKVSKNGVFSAPYFPIFGLNIKIYGINLRFQTENGKIRTRRKSVPGHFSQSEFCRLFLDLLLKFDRFAKEKIPKLKLSEF